MSSVSPIQRCRDVKERIGYIRDLLGHTNLSALADDVVSRAAFERFLEIISEASRHIPADWQQEFGPRINWRQLTDLGNIIRHVYQRADLAMLWGMYETDLDPLEAAIDAMIAAYGPIPRPPPRSP